MKRFPISGERLVARAGSVSHSIRASHGAVIATSVGGGVALASPLRGRVRIGPRTEAVSGMTSVVIAQFTADGTRRWSTVLRDPRALGQAHQTKLGSSDPELAGIVHDGKGHWVVVGSESGHLRLGVPKGKREFVSNAFAVWLRDKGGRLQHGLRYSGEPMIAPGGIGVLPGGTVAVGASLLADVAVRNYDGVVVYLAPDGTESTRSRTGLAGVYGEDVLALAGGGVLLTGRAYEGVYLNITATFDAGRQLTDVGGYRGFFPRFASTDSGLRGVGNLERIGEGVKSFASLEPKGNADLVFAEFDDKLDPTRIRHFPASGYTTVRKCRAKKDTVVAVGHVSGGTIDLGTGTLPVPSSPPPGESETRLGYVVAFDPAGRTVFAHAIGGTTEIDVGDAAIADDGAIYVAGHVTGDLRLGTASAPGTGRALFLAKLEPPAPP